MSKKTSQCLAERKKQHLPQRLFRSRRECKDVARAPSDSAITSHVRDHHECLEEKLSTCFQVVARVRNQQHLDFLEALIIKTKTHLCVFKNNMYVF